MNKAQGCDKKCKQEKREKRDRKKLRQLKKKKNKKPSRQGKKGKNGGRKAGRKTVKGRTLKKKGKKGPKVSKKKAQIKESNGPRSSSTSGTGRQDTCFTDMVAKTKKFNKAQVEFRLAKRVESWGKLMKNKKNNSASTFSDALEAMNEATGNGMSCEGDSSSLAEAKKFKKSWRTALPVQETTVMR